MANNEELFVGSLFELGLDATRVGVAFGSYRPSLMPAKISFFQADPPIKLSTQVFDKSLFAHMLKIQS